ncbi:unnamed protein product [Lampetra fluviatilis]
MGGQSAAGGLRATSPPAALVDAAASARATVAGGVWSARVQLIGGEGLGGPDAGTPSGDDSRRLFALSNCAAAVRSTPVAINGFGNGDVDLDLETQIGDDLFERSSHALFFRLLSGRAKLRLPERSGDSATADDHGKWDEADDGMAAKWGGRGTRQPTKTATAEMERRGQSARTE